jgi:hypothetical protein
MHAEAKSVFKCDEVVKKKNLKRKPVMLEL